ncbi:DUF485 domain-containing protein [Altericroceibacterium xinjiangense]|uniref:DUF485 domain-containing protein n=1 Tax=Altericroceibacterium xinjiangense TaxID=762261 RepID=UPI0013DFE556|nr:DUF485 domain-containing protein [Altericroceibacterium xinjiangense]
MERLADDPRYQRLVRQRSVFGWTLTGLMLVVYFGFILLVAFAKPFMGSSLAGGATSVGIPLGLGVILFAIALTGIYVHRANSVFDIEMKRLRAEFDT